MDRVSNVVHQPVLLREVISLLNLLPGNAVVDGTMGLGGHSSEIIKQIQPNGRLIGIDFDKSALEIAKERLVGYQVKIDLFCDNFGNLGNILKELNLKGVDAILLDLGMSSYQLADSNRGFSFLAVGPLDMRMSHDAFTRASDIINRAPEKELIRIFQEYGEERFSKRIARKIIGIRHRRKIETTADLVNVIYESVPFKQGKIHPATRVFQALRIATNKELENLSIFLNHTADYLNPKGHLAIVSFHSLEDRLVKHKFIENKRKEIFSLITKKPIRPGIEEINRNPRARSAKLRVAEKI